MVDTVGLLPAVVAHAANVQDRDGAKLVLVRHRRTGSVPQAAVDLG